MLVGINDSRIQPTMQTTGDMLAGTVRAKCNTLAGDGWGGGDGDGSGSGWGDGGYWGHDGVDCTITGDGSGLPEPDAGASVC